METDCIGGAPRRPRTPFSRRHVRRFGASLGAVAVAALLAGCGTASSSSSTTATTAGSTTNATGGFDPSLVPAGGSAPGAAAKTGKTKSAKHHGKGHSTKHSAPSHPSQAAPSGSGGGSSSGSGSASGGAPSPAPASGGTHTVTVSHTSTVTVTRYVRPNVPAGAGLPSTAAPLSVGHFDTAGGTLACRISGATVRCDVARRDWTAPSKPASCHAAWGQGLMIGGSGSASFVCARNSVLDPTLRYIRPGYDDKVGHVTCQVRRFGVTCFEPDRHGFFISRTGYIRF